jgi:hypothetical protein
VPTLADGGGAAGCAATQEEFDWARATAHTRAMGAQVDGAACAFIVPGVDLANHSFAPNAIYGVSPDGNHFQLSWDSSGDERKPGWDCTRCIQLALSLEIACMSGGGGEGRGGGGGGSSSGGGGRGGVGSGGARAGAGGAGAGAGNSSGSGGGTGGGSRGGGGSWGGGAEVGSGSWSAWVGAESAWLQPLNL